MSTAAVERAKPAVQTRKNPRARGLLAVGGFVGVVAYLYFADLARVRAAGGNRRGLWPFVALGVWACDAHPVRIRNRKVSMSMGLSEVPDPGRHRLPATRAHVGRRVVRLRGCERSTSGASMKTLFHSAIYVAPSGAGIAVYYALAGPGVTGRGTRLAGQRRHRGARRRAWTSCWSSLVIAVVDAVPARFP